MHNGTLAWLTETLVYNRAIVNVISINVEHKTAHGAFDAYEKKRQQENKIPHYAPTVLKTKHTYVTQLLTA